MFRARKVQEFSFIKISKKFLNDRESFQRVKHLRCIIENTESNELNIFFTKNCSSIFNAFYDVFMNVQIELQQKVNTSHFKELQNILAVFEKILTILPELIKLKWQFNCIYGIIKTLLHPNNIIKIRLQGTQLFILWFQILGDHAPKPCYDLFIFLIPIFEPIIKKIIFQDNNKSSTNSQDSIVPIIEIEIKPVLTQNIDKEVELEDVDQYLLRYLLRYIVTEGIKVEWDDRRGEKQLTSYTFLLDQFKEYFLPVIFPKCSSDYTIENNMKQSIVTTEFLENYSPVANNYPIDGNKIFHYQEEVIRWIAELVCTDNSNIDTRLKISEDVDSERRTGSMKAYSGQGKSSSIDNVLVKFDKENLKIEISVFEKIHQILFQNEENVNIINQLCQHAFYLPLLFHKTHLSIIFVYKSWLFPCGNQHPTFMLDGDASSPSAIRDLSTINDPTNEVNKKVKISPTMQRVIFTNIATVFLHNYRDPLVSQRSSPTKKHQINAKQLHSDLIKRIMAGIYRKAVNGIANLETEHLMNVLLDISFNVLSSNSPYNRPDNHWISNDAYIGQFFQTLNVLLIKSNLVSYISEDLWNRFLQVYSSLVMWVPIVNEWKKTLELILKMLGKILYNVDMNDLPLEKKVRRGRPGNNLKRNNGSKLIKRAVSNEDHTINPNMPLNPNQSNTMNYNSSLNSTLNIHPRNTFTESLNQNTDDSPFVNDNIGHNSIKSDLEESNQSELNKRFQFDECNENDAASFASSSHEENSSYMSAEDSSSPHCKDKAAETNSGLLSDNEFMPLSSSGGDTSIEINNSFDTSIKPLYGEENEDNNVDADDEYEVDVNHGITIDGTSKSATLTREESDIDIAVTIYRYEDHTGQIDTSRTPTKCAARRKVHQLKEEDRNSMHLDDNIANAFITEDDFSNQVHSSENVNSRHVLLGGSVIGWNQESAVLLWKRCIGLMGNVTQITDVEILTMIFEYFSDLTNSLIKMRENMCVPCVNQSTPHPPSYVPPIDYIVPWLFEIFTLGAIYDDIKIIALKTLCRITVRKMDIEPSIEHLVQFYVLVHSILQDENMVFICTLVENIGVNFFSIPLCGVEILIPDIIKACEIVLQAPLSKVADSKIAKLPKLEAVSILGSLLKFQDHYGTIKTFDSTSKTIHIVDSTSYRVEILRLLTFCAKNEHLIGPRTLSIVTIASYCYSEVVNLDISPTDLNDLRQSILLVLSLMRFKNYEIATISADMIRFLVTCFPQIQEKLPHIPEKIIQVLSWTINHTRIQCKRELNSCSRKLLTTMIFTLVDWCMSLPLNQLLDSNDLHPKGLVHLAFSALENVLKYDDTNAGKMSTTSSLKQNAGEKNQNIESRRTSTIFTGNQPMSHSGLSIDPLIEFPHLFEVQSIQEDLSVKDVSTVQSASYAKDNELIKLAARTALCHLINHIGQFPKNNVLGCLSSSVKEHHDCQVYKVNQLSDKVTENAKCDDVSSEIFNSPDLQMFVVNGSMIVSLLAINTNVSPKSPQSPNQIQAPGGPPVGKLMADCAPKESDVRIIIRDLCGKYCWDVTFVHKCEEDPDSSTAKLAKDVDSLPPSPPPRRTLPIVVVPEKSVIQKGMTIDKCAIDQVDKLFADLVQLSPEMFSCNSSKSPCPDSAQSSLESLAKQQISDQHTIEYDYFDSTHCMKISYPKLTEKRLRSNVTIEKSPDNVAPVSRFYFCRQILNQLGFLSLKRRSSIDLIQKSNIYLDLKCIDSLRSRETHKIAVLYVAWGQEDKASILGNTESSLEFRNFISGLGWTIDLETHGGFMGGLESSGKDGKYAPYYATSSLEIMFHVSTWMQSMATDDKPNKFKHLGNDEVMVIWSENYRDYRSNIMKTEFGDVMIIIYPLRNGLFGINIKTKGEHKLFGPLYDGSIVGERELPGLVRATAINAGRSIRESRPHFEEYYVERANYMEKAIKKFIEPMSFEGFAENVYGSTINDIDESVSEINRGTESIKTPGIKISDTSTHSISNLENIPSCKGTGRLSSSPKSVQKLSSGSPPRSIDDCTDHNLNRKLSKISRHK